MTRGHQLVERAADRLDAYARLASREPGLKAKLAGPLADDAELLRGMRPSRIAARLRGEPGDASPSPTASREPISPVEAEPRERSRRRGPSPIVLAAGTFALGLLIAKVLDWRSHAHPR
jgi:hypothetical protein